MRRRYDGPYRPHRPGVADGRAEHAGESCHDLHAEVRAGLKVLLRAGVYRGSMFPHRPKYPAHYHTSLCSSLGSISSSSSSTSSTTTSCFHFR